MTTTLIINKNDLSKTSCFVSHDETTLFFEIGDKNYSFDILKTGKNKIKFEVLSDDYLRIVIHYFIDYRINFKCVSTIE